MVVGELVLDDVADGVIDCVVEEERDSEEVAVDDTDAVVVVD